MTDPMTNLFGPLDGAHLPGGCDTCDAYQTITPTQAGIWTLTIHHDEWCPALTSTTEQGDNP